MTGTIQSLQTSGFFGAALLPATASLTAASPCLPSGARRTQVNSSNSFRFEDVAAGSYRLVGYRVYLRRIGGFSFPEEIELTTRIVTVGSQVTDAGIVALPDRLTVIDSVKDRMSWSVPPQFETQAFRLGSSDDACDPGVALSVSAPYELNVKGMTKVKVVVADPAAGQMAIDLGWSR